MVQKVGRLGIDDILNFYFSTPPAATTSGINNILLRRFTNVLNVAGGYTLPTDEQAKEEEAKGLIRVYQDFLKPVRSSLNDGRFSNFYNYVLSPAEEHLIEKFVTTPGLGVAIDGDVIVGEDETVLARNRKHGHANDRLVGSNENDLIFGESGLDVLEGKGGDDVLHGGLGFDTYIFRAGESFPGHDYVVDNDGGQLFYYTSDGTLVLLSGGERETTGPAGIWTQEVADGTVQYAQSGNDLDITTPDGGTITVKDYFLGTLAMNIGLSGSTIQGLNNVRAMGITLLSDASDAVAGDHLYGTEYSDSNYTFLPAADLAGGGAMDTMNGIHVAPGLVRRNWANLQEIAAGTPDNALLSIPMERSVGEFGIFHGLQDLGIHAVYGDLGSDDLIGNMGGRNLVLDGGDGHDRLRADGFDLYLDDLLNMYATSPDPLLDFVNGYNVSGPGATLNGGAGHDDILGGRFNDVIEAGSGHDFVWADPGGYDVRPFNPSFVVPAGAGHDYLDGGSGNDVLIGVRGNDVIRGGPETSPTETDHDYLLGGAGDDQLLGGAGDDWLYGTYGTLRPAPARNTRVARMGTKVPLQLLYDVGSVHLKLAA